MENKLSTIPVYGTEFIADVRKGEIREAANPSNVIKFNDMTDVVYGYTFPYSFMEKNLPSLFKKPDALAHIPPMKQLDLVGMAERYGKTIEEIADKSDYEIIVRTDLVERRLQHGALPVIEIHNWPFYIDLRHDNLRPKDDFSTEGIKLSKIEPYFVEHLGKYHIPYDPVKHEFVPLDLERITAIPDGIFVVEIPGPEELDPVGFARLHGLDMKRMVRKYPIQEYMYAEIIPWKDTIVQQRIGENLQKQVAGNGKRPNEEQSGRKKKSQKM